MLQDMRTSHVLGLSPAGFHRVAYTEWGDPGAPDVVICVHGLTRNGRDFDPLARALAPRARVVCPDVVGRGRSDWLARPEHYTYAQYLADMNALIARVGADAGPGATIDWVGTSMGGMIGMLLAAQPGSPIRRLVLNDIGALIPAAALERIGTYVGKAPRFGSLEDAERYVRTVSAPFGALTDAQWRHLTVHNLRPAEDGGWRMAYDPAIAGAFAERPAGDVLLWDVWERVRCPTLLLRGADSDLLQHGTAQRMLARGPDVNLIEFPDVGHAPTLLTAEQYGPVVDFLRAPGAGRDDGARATPSRAEPC